MMLTYFFVIIRCLKNKTQIFWAVWLFICTFALSNNKYITIMKAILLVRVSTEAQDFTEQEREIY